MTWRPGTLSIERLWSDSSDDSRAEAAAVDPGPAVPAAAGAAAADPGPAGPAAAGAASSSCGSDGSESSGEATTPRDDAATEGHVATPHTGGATARTDAVRANANRDLMDMLDDELPPLPPPPPPPPPPSAADIIAARAAARRGEEIQLVHNAITDTREDIDDLPARSKARFVWAVRYEFDEVGDVYAEDQVRAIAERGVRFKVGITADPVWRWFGGVTANENVVRGHMGDGWERIHVIAVRVGANGPALERRLIEFAWSLSTQNCANVNRGGGGIHASRNSVTFLYVLSM